MTIDTPVEAKVDPDVDQRLSDFKLDISKDADPLAEQRDQANQDMRFVNVNGGQWEDFLTEEFAQRRAKLQFDLTSPRVNRTMGEWNLNRVGVEFKPTDGKTTDKDAEMLNGIYRADFRDNNGKQATDNAVRQGLTCGYGAMKLATEFEDPGDPENDQQTIVWRGVVGAFNHIYWDRNAKRADKSDANYCTELIEFTRESFKQAYPEADPSSAYTPNTRGFKNFLSGTVIDIIYVAVRYQIEKKKEVIFKYSNLKTNEVEVYSEEDHKLVENELKADKFRRLIRKRKVVKQRVVKYVFNGTEFLDEPQKIAGEFIPIIPFYGYRDYVDSVEWYYGLVRKMKDPQRAYNTQMSQVVENAASSGKETPIFDPDQITPAIAAQWANPTNKAFMYAKVLRDKTSGQVIAAGPVGHTKPASLDQSTQALINIIPQYFQTVGGGPPQDTLDPNASGKAINAMIKRENLDTQPMMDNFAMSIEHSGRVYASMAQDIYTTPRILRTIGQDGAQSTVELMKTVQDSETGKIVQVNTLKDKRFKAYADIGPQYETLREQALEEQKGMMELMLKGGPATAQHLPLMMSVALENHEGPGMDKVKKVIRREMLANGTQEPETDEDREFLASIAQQPQDNSQQQLIEGLTNQANAEAQENLATARNKDADSLLKGTASRKNLAQTRQILSETETNKAKTLNEMLNDNLKRVQSLPFGPS